MGVLFVPYPADGHVNPILPVVAELVSRGRRVRVVVVAGHARCVAAVGAEPVRLSVDPDVYVPERFLGAGGLRLVVGWVRRAVVVCAVRRLTRDAVRCDRPDLVVVDPMMGGADRVATRAGVAVVVISSTYAANEFVPYRLPERCPSSWWGGPLRHVARRVRPVVRRARGRPVLVNAVPELQPARSTLGTDVRFVGPLLRRPGRLDAEWSWLLRLGQPVLLVSAGTVFARTPAFFATIVEAFAGTGWWVVMATGAVDPAVVGPLPGNVVTRRWVPQRALLPHCAVFLTHAGMNSALESLAAGVPMVLAPRAGDQLFIARRLVELGVGVRLPAGRLRSDTVRDLVERVAADAGMRAAAARWQERFATSRTARQAADLLLRHMDLRGD